MKARVESIREINEVKEVRFGLQEEECHLLTIYSPLRLNYANCVVRLDTGDNLGHGDHFGVDRLENLGSSEKSDQGPSHSIHCRRKAFR